MRILKLNKTAQDFQGYFSGAVPDYAASLVGTPSVDASQIQSMFGRVDDAIRLVNQFDSSLLNNISFIFNFSKSGAYGVYLPSLDRAIKTKVLAKKLEGMGYRIETDDKGLLTAFPVKEEKTQDQIQRDIDSVYSDLESKGGTAFGINMNDVLSSARMDANSAQSQDPNIWEWMALLHLGGTIVHEAVHAKGNEGEGPSEAAEASFLNWALPIVNKEYMNYLEEQGQGELYSPLIMTGEVKHANGKNWYKTAEMSYYIPKAFLNDPSGSDLAGRYPVGIQTDMGIAGWSMMMQDGQSVPIEERLGRQYMSPLPSDLSQEHDSYEEQLRKYTRDDKKLDPHATMEELLSEGHDEPRAYETTEYLLNEKRIKPLMSPLKKAASNNMVKTATLFGWMNNLEISDGSTIPGLSDRVMAWDDRDESFSGAEKDIRSQPRYNPTYDIKGFYYRYIEPRFQPQLWDQMVGDLSNTAPAKRFGSTEKDNDLWKVVSILSLINKKIRNGDINCTRLIMSEDVLPIALKILRDCCVSSFAIDKKEKEIIYAVWACPDNKYGDKIKMAEEAFRSGSDEVEKLIEDLTRYSEMRESVFQEIIETVRNICKEYGVSDIYLVGGYPRDLVLGSSPVDLDFSGAWPNQCVKIGGLAAERLGVGDIDFYHRTMTLSFEYKGVKVDFRGNYNPLEIRKNLREKGIKTTPLNIDIYNRDFTINMFIYDILNGGIYDVCKSSLKDVRDGKIRTFFDPKFICGENPLVIMRALKFKLRYGFKIDLPLQTAMITNAPKLFDGRYTDERLRMAREDVEREDRGRAKELFEEYGLERIMEI